MTLTEYIQKLEETKQTLRTKLSSVKLPSKLSPWARLQNLIDADSFFLEIGTLVGDEEDNDKFGLVHGGSLIGGIGTIAGKKWVIIVSNYYNKSGVWVPATNSKCIRLQEYALRNKLPVVYLLESAGIFLPTQHKTYAGKYDIGRCFANMCKIKNAGLYQISVVLGPCIAGASYVALGTNEVFISKEHGAICLAGSYLTKASVGQDIDLYELGGSTTLMQDSGSVDYVFENNQACIDATKKRIASINSARLVTPKQLVKFDEPEISIGHFVESFTDDGRPYDMHLLIKGIIDGNSWLEYKQGFGVTVICGYATVGGLKVGVIATQQLLQKVKGNKIEMGGVLYKDSLLKCTMFLETCNQLATPVLFLQDVVGFMAGIESEHDGILKAGLALLNKIILLQVPFCTIIIRRSAGTPGILFGGHACDPNFIFAWPTATVHVMNSKEAVKVILQTKSKSDEAGLQPVDVEKKYEEIRNEYARTSTAYYAASQMWVDEIINPLDTRKIVLTCLEIFYSV
ncbi:MAG: carboxyl transferase domain-containing protein [Phycisphaerales bacterium]|nr:carboxyl transferase domain-containing protein [Phycisphaerales bacterium]